jgi:lipopolysaccharide transport system permease protein
VTTQADEIRIRPGGAAGNYWRDVWHYRELFYFLAWRDIAVRYKQTAIGVAWGVLRPLLTMAVFTIVFGKIARLPSPGVPYAVLVFSGLLPWTFASSAVTEAANSMVANSNMISKIYFPRLILPTSAVMVAVVDFVITLGLLFVLMLFLRYGPTIQLLVLPVFAFMAFLVALGAGLWLSALNVKYRDFRFVVPFIIQVGIYVSPVGFSSSLVPDRWRLLYSINPMVGVIDGFRWAILGHHATFSWPSFAVSAAVGTLILIGGLWYFRSTERAFADVI